MMSLRTTIIAALGLSFGLACSGGGDGKVDDSGTDDTNPSGDSGDDTGPIGDPGYAEVSSPCGGQNVYAILFASDTVGWVGCGADAGVHETADGGDSFSEIDLATGLDIYDLSFAPNGDLYACGNGTADNVTSFLWRYDGGSWERLLDYDTVKMSNCGQVASARDGEIFVVSLTIGDITFSTDGGSTWDPNNERYWAESNLDDASAKDAYQIAAMEAVNGGYYGSGSIGTEPPYFYRPSDHPDAEPFNMEVVTIDGGFRGWSQSLATPDGGTTWLAGGRDEDISDDASGYIYRSEDGGETWDSLPLGPEIDVVHDIKFSEDGVHGVAVGHRYPPASKGGFVLLTYDGGQTWQELDADLPIMQSAAASGGTFWVGGDGYMGRGEF